MANYSEEAYKFWALLDDMAENNPAAYRKFIDKQMKEGKTLMAKPEIFLAFKAKSLYSSVIVAICSWERVRSAESDDHPLPMLSGDHEDENKSAERIYYVAVNPSICSRCSGDSQDSKDHREALISLTIRFLNDTKKTKLNLHFYEETNKSQLKENEMFQSLHFDPTFHPQNILSALTGNQPKEPEPPNLATISLTDMLNTMKSPSSGDNSNQQEQFQLLLPQKTTEIDKSSSKPMIEEVAEEFASHDSRIQCRRDKCNLIVDIFLKDVHSVSDVTLDISNSALLVEIKKSKETVKFDFPISVNSSTAKAKFHKKTHVLSICVIIPL